MSWGERLDVDGLHRGAGFEEADAVTGELPSSSGGRSRAWGQSLGTLTKQGHSPEWQPVPRHRRTVRAQIMGGLER